MAIPSINDSMNKRTETLNDFRLKEKAGGDTLRIAYSFELLNLELCLWYFWMDHHQGVHLWKLWTKRINLASCFNSSLCIDWQILKSSTANFRNSWFARLQDLDHNNKKLKIKQKKTNVRKGTNKIRNLGKGKQTTEAHLYDAFKTLVSSTL